MSGAPLWRGRPDADWNSATKKALKELEIRWIQPGTKATPSYANKRVLLQAVKNAADAQQPALTNAAVGAAFGLRPQPAPPAGPASGTAPQTAIDLTHDPDPDVESGPSPANDPSGTSYADLAQATPVSIQQALQDAFRRSLPNPSHYAMQLNAAEIRHSRRGVKNPDFESVHGLNIAGRFYPHRGRGPIWESNSCAVDCCIVAALLMNVGSTVIDMGPADLPNRVPTLQTEFLKMVRENWDFLPAARGGKLRNTFLLKLLPAIHREAGAFLPMIATWRLCASAFKQYTYTEAILSRCNTCGGSRVSKVGGDEAHRLTISKLGPRFADQHPTMQQLLARHFATEDRITPCNFTCKGKPDTVERRRIIYGALPPRLVVEPGGDYRNISQANVDDITFQYLDSDGNDHDVTYRWLGGIYNNHQLKHYRTYWTDCDYLDASGHIKIYDGMVGSGSIVGGIPPALAREKVPASWATGAVLLFYERVDTPDLEAMVGEVTAALTALRAGFKTSGGLATPSAMPGGAGVAGPSTPSTKRKHEETESPDKEEQESRKRPHPDPGSTSPTGPPKKAPKKSPSTPPKKAESPGEKSKSPKGKGRAVSKTPSPRAATEKGRPSSQG